MAKQKQAASSGFGNTLLGGAMLLILASGALAACTWKGNKPADLTPEQRRAEMLFSAETDAKVALINAKSAQAVAKIDAETNKIKARAQTEINEMIQNSVHDKALLKNWNLGTDGVTWQASHGGNAIYFHDGNSISYNVPSCSASCPKECGSCTAGN